MTHLVCPDAIRGVTNRAGLAAAVNELYPGQAMTYQRAQRALQQRRCAVFTVLGMVLPAEVDWEGNLRLNHGFRLRDNIAVCAEHGGLAIRYPSRWAYELQTLGQALGQWIDQSCGMTFTTEEFVLHLNTQNQCRRYAQDVVMGAIEVYPAGINFDQERAANHRAAAVADENGIEIDEPFEDEPEEDLVDDDRGFDEVDEEPELRLEDVLTAAQLGIAGLTVTNHFNDTGHPPVTTGDGRYLRWNDLNQQYEQARRPATTLHDAMEAQP